MLSPYHIPVRAIDVEHSLNLKRNILSSLCNHQMPSLIPHLWELQHLYSVHMVHLSSSSSPLTGGLKPVHSLQHIIPFPGIAPVETCQDHPVGRITFALPRTTHSPC